MSDDDVDRFAARPREIMNTREREYYEAFLHLQEGRRPENADNLRKWEARRLRVTVSSVCAELGGAERAPIGFEQAKYRWIWYLIQREGKRLVEPDWSPDRIGARGLAASLQASRSLLADQIAKTEAFAEKAMMYDAMRESLPKFGVKSRR
ncbi:hypothetical protein [Sphingomonas sp. BAUL-RG-20F-R05-02]|uniref:hypothetical protein n=1 Tax=Sphingomonas sp. BAUL-RG-20F-R05-02 TaxID=2914830 RepID=UPI001F58397B|nr:hypothetical protein [Sphingomonas sp. BAUL-RG-20F-R05-02]